MQTVNATLLNRLRNVFDTSTTVRQPCDLIEFYAHDYIPSDVSGFNPADAVQRFAAISITWNGLAYRRAVVSRGDISKQIGIEDNNVSLTFSNVESGHYLATWAQTTQIEGLWCVIRYVERDITTDSLVLFAGRAGKPSTINNKSFSLSISASLADANDEIPPRTFTTEDPLGRDPSDPLYEGIRFIAIAGSFNYTSIVPAHHAIARIFGQRDTDLLTKQYSSFDATPYGDVIPEILGRCQMELKPFIWADKGVFVSALWAISNGPIAAVDNIKTRSEGLSDPINSFGSPPAPAIVHLGDLGGTGTNTGNTGQADLGGGQVFSHLAYVEGAIVPRQVLIDPTFSDPEILNELPVVTALVKGRIVPLPDNTGVYNLTGWTDNPVHLSRWVFTYLLNIPSGLMGDSVTYLTSLKCDAAIPDDSGSEIIYVPTSDVGVVTRYRSTGVIDSRYIRYYRFGEIGLDDPPITPVDPDGWNPTGTLPTFTVTRLYRKRYTFNAPITERTKAIDFLYKTLYPSFRGYHVINSKGKVEIRTEEKADNAFLRSSSIVGATSILVDDVTPWKTSLQGYLLIGYGLTTSEVRTVTSAVYTSLADAITLSASSTGITATASGATLSGGSTTVQSSGTVTLSGTISGTVTVTINGYPVTLIIDANDSLASAAAALADRINGDPTLSRFIAATYSGAVLTIKAKWGSLNFSALAFAHNGPKANPSVAPTLASSAGTLAAGTYLVAYSYVNSLGETIISPTQTITIIANKKIDVTGLGALPAGITSVNWYMSDVPNSTKLLYIANNNGSAFSLTSLPSKNNAGIPPYNSTGEESMRIALSFSSNSQGATILAQSGLTRANIKPDSYNFPLGSEQSSVNQIKGKFRDSANDFALTPFTVNDYAHQALVGKVNPLEVDFSGVDNWNQANRLAQGLLAKYRDADWFNSLSTGTGEALLLEEGDLITSSDDSGGHVNETTRVESFSISPTWEVTIRKARKYSTAMFSDDVRQRSIPLPSVLRYIATSDTQFVPMDLPYWRDADPPNVPGFHLAESKSMADGDWRGTVVFSDASGAYTALTQKIENNVPIGESLNALTSTSNVYTLDNISTVRVQILTPGTDNGTYQLLSTTEEKLLAGANKYALGINGRWEIGQFQTATLVGGTTDTYDLTVHLRGRNGTEGHTSDHITGDSFVLLTDSDGNDTGVTFVPIDYNLLNRTFNLKAVTTNQDVVDAAPQSFTWTGLVLRPLTVVNARGTRDADNNLLIQFEGRTRIGGGLRSNQAGAVNEEEEIYKVQILDSGTPVAREPLIVIPGTPTAMLLQADSPDSANVNTTNNSIEILTNTYVLNARSYQRIDATGNYIEAVLSNSEAAGGSALLGIIAPGTSWQGVGNVVPLCPLAVNVYGGSGIPRAISIYENNVEVLYVDTINVDGTGTPFKGQVKVKITFSGTEIRVLLQIPKADSDILYRATFPPTFPYHALLQVAEKNGTKITMARMTTYPFPATIYAPDQATADGLTPGDPVEMDIYQWSKVLGDGQKVRVTL